MPELKRKRGNGCGRPCLRMVGPWLERPLARRLFRLLWLLCQRWLSSATLPTGWWFVRACIQHTRVTVRLVTREFLREWWRFFALSMITELSCTRFSPEPDSGDARGMSCGGFSGCGRLYGCRWAVCRPPLAWLPSGLPSSGLLLTLHLAFVVRGI